MFFFTRNLFLCTQCESIDGQGQIEEYPPQGSFCQVCTVLPHNVLFCTGSVQMWRKHEERVGCGARALITPGVNAGVRARSSPRLDNQKEPSTHFTFGSHTSTLIKCRSWTLSSKNKCFSFREDMEARLVPCKQRRVGQSLGEGLFSDFCQS